LHACKFSAVRRSRGNTVMNAAIDAIGYEETARFSPQR
jgi:hypothetical protein